MLVAANKELYVTLPKRQKMLLSQSIVNAVRSQNPPGRFLQKDAKTDLWYDVGDKRSQEKTSQALREGAPEIRMKLKDKVPEENGKSKTPSPEKQGKSLDDSSASQEDAKVAAPSKVASEDYSDAAKSAAVASTDHVASPSPPPPSAVEAMAKKIEASTRNQPPSAPSSNNSQLVMPPPPPQAPPTMMAPPAMPPPIPPQGPVPIRNKNKKREQKQPPTQEYERNSGNNSGVMDSMDPSYPEDQQQRQPRQVHFPENQQIQQQYQYYTPYPQQQEAMPPPPTSMEANGEFSFGSMGMMSMGEQDRLMKEKFDDEPIPFTATSGISSNSGPVQQQQQQDGGDHDMPQPVDGGLEPIGLSFGSMMSMGTEMGMAAAAAAEKLESGGLSFGSAMSYSVVGPRHSAAAPPDGGLQDIGTSFGSLSLADGERERIIAAAEREMMMAAATTSAADAEVAPPTFLQQQKSTGNLLDCSDTESEDEDTSAEASAQKSAKWEMLQKALAEQDQTIRNSQLTAAMPPPAFAGNRNNHQHNMNSGRTHHNQQPQPAIGSTFQIPTVGLDRDFSQMSAISVQEDFEPLPAATQSYVVPMPAAVQKDVYDSEMPPPPPDFKKGRSDDWSQGDLDGDDEDANLEFTFLNRGNSLASEKF